MKFFLAIVLAFLLAVASGFVAETVFSPVEEKPGRPEPVLHLIARANVERGARLARACMTCHTFEKGAVSIKEGPNLWDIVGKEKASVKSFNYSESMIEAGGRWTYMDLNKYLWNPKYLIPGGSMNYIGMRKTRDRADLIAWMRTLSDNMEPLPAEEEIKAEKLELLPDNIPAEKD
jgi:cytochrome c